jgi:Ca2+-binding RTX toxin-like protein
MTTLVPWGHEFLVKSIVAFSQGDPAVSALADGRFVVVWSDLSQTPGDTSLYAVRGQIFRADGSPSGAEFLVNTTTQGVQFTPVVTGLAGGRFVVAWRDDSFTGGDTSGAAVRAQVFGPGGGKLGGEFLLPTTTLSGQEVPSVTAQASGGFVAAWRDSSRTGGDTSSTAIRSQLFDASGGRVGAEILVNSTTSGQQTSPTTAALVGGGFVVAWSDSSQTGGDTSLTAIRAQVFQASGSPHGSEFVVNITTDSIQSDPAAHGLAGGGFVITWQDSSATGGDADSLAIRAQVFNASGSPLGGELLVNTTTVATQSAPRVAALADGRFVVTWMDLSQTGGDTQEAAIRAQVFQADGSRSGSEFLVNGTTVGTQMEPTVTVLADGRLVFGWADFSGTSPDNDSSAVRARIFDPRESAIHLTGTALADQWVGSRWADTLAGGAGNDRLQGRAAHDVLTGGLGVDWLQGDAGNDTLNGGAGQDTLLGGTGKDRLTGAADNDRFVWRSAAEAGNGVNRDVVTDFAMGLDKLDLSRCRCTHPAGWQPGIQFHRQRRLHRNCRAVELCRRHSCGRYQRQRGCELPDPVGGQPGHHRGRSDSVGQPVRPSGRRAIGCNHQLLVAPALGAVATPGSPDVASYQGPRCGPA